MPALDPALIDAYVYTFPFYEMARTRYLSVQANVPGGQTRINILGHRKALSDHTARAVTTPNNDTLYSSAWLDLSTGPLELTIPRIAKRYWSVHFMDASTSTAALVGSRNAGEGDMKLWIASTDDTTVAPAGVREVRLPSRDAWMLIRIVVDSPEDISNVQALQAGLSRRVLNGPSQPSSPILPKPALGSPVDGANYLAVVNDMLQRNPKAGAFKPLPSAWQPFGFGLQATAEQGAALTAALPDLNMAVRAGGGLSSGARDVQGWSYPNPAVGTFGTDYGLRAGVALAGLGALPPEEAIYLSTTTDKSSQALDGQQRYRLRVPSSGIPTHAFWSLSMYQIEPDGRMFFTDNPIKRYTVGDRTPGLVKGADGSLDITLQRDEPTDPQQKANWLPTPAGKFRLMLRAYLPSVALAAGQVNLPTIEKLK